MPPLTLGQQLFKPLKSQPSVYKLGNEESIFSFPMKNDEHHLSEDVWKFSIGRLPNIHRGCQLTLLSQTQEARAAQAAQGWEKLPFGLRAALGAAGWGEHDPHAKAAAALCRFQHLQAGDLQLPVSAFWFYPRSAALTLMAPKYYSCGLHATRAQPCSPSKLLHPALCLSLSGGGHSTSGKRSLRR